MVKTLREMGAGKQSMEDHTLEEIKFTIEYLETLIGKVRVIYVVLIRAHSHIKASLLLTFHGPSPVQTDIERSIDSRKYRVIPPDNENKLHNDIL